MGKIVDRLITLGPMLGGAILAMIWFAAEILLQGSVVILDIIMDHSLTSDPKLLWWFTAVIVMLGSYLGMYVSRFQRKLDEEEKVRKSQNDLN